MEIKNIPNIFDVTLQRVDIAIARSERLRAYYNTQEQYMPSNMNPGTRVDVLLRELMEYIR